MQQGYTRLETYNAQTIELSCGAMSYVDQGSGDTILVAHGISGGYDQAFDSANTMTKTNRILAPSRFGYLESRMPKEATPAMQAKAYVELLDTLGIAKAYILGTSAVVP